MLKGGRGRGRRPIGWWRFPLVDVYRQITKVLFLNLLEENSVELPLRYNRTMLHHKPTRGRRGWKGCQAI